MPDQSRELPHIYLPDSGKSENYTSPRTGSTPPPPIRDRGRHANELERAIGQALVEAQKQLESREPGIASGKPGFYLEFQVQADKANAFEKLENRQKEIELVAVHQSPEQKDVVQATVFVPESATNYFLSKVEKYRDKETKTGKPKNEALVARLDTVQLGTVRSLFTDDSALFPQDGQEVWWEVWLRRDQRKTFELVTRRLNIQTKPHTISFPEREVILAMANVEAMARIIKNSDAVAELRIAKDTPSIFCEMSSVEQTRWVRELEDRILAPGEYAIALCLLDCGVTQTHPLIRRGLDPSDMHTYLPETVRALIVHSAEWTPAMQRHFQSATTQKAKRPLLRRYGYGVPNLVRALQSANNDLTLIVEDELQPFDLENNRIKTREMMLHSLPWPSEELEGLGDINVELKVTLSYFIEPNPGERGWGKRHRYASHGLRFEVKRSLESHNDFRRRINRAAREEEENTTTRTESDNWFLGSNLRNRGSIHSDTWYGNAVELAQRGAIAVYPIGGWWKEKPHLERWHQSARYSLIVSLRVPEVEIDIYTPVSNLITQGINIST